MKGLVGGPMLVGGLGPAPRAPPLLKSGPDTTYAFSLRTTTSEKHVVARCSDLG